MNLWNSESRPYAVAAQLASDLLETTAVEHVQLFGSLARGRATCSQTSI